MRYEVAFTSDFFTFALAWGNVAFTGSPAEKIPLQFKQFASGDHSFFWDRIIPATAQGAAVIEIRLLRIPGGFSRLTSTFTVAGSPPVQPPAYIGSVRCMSCHAGFNPDVVSAYTQSGHYYALANISGAAPQLPSFSAGVPDPPPGYAWSGIAYVIGGYGWAANFTSAASGLLITGGQAQYNPASSTLGTPAEFAAYTPASDSFTCASCHATGYQPGGPGSTGTWSESAVGCEACHGPGSLHALTPHETKPPANASSSCDVCHTFGSTGAVEASAGLIGHMQQADELRVSPKSFLTCTSCHNPHASAHFDGQAAGTAIVKNCTECHAGVTVGLGMQSLNCVDCHMPYAVRAGAAITYADKAGSQHALGDMRTHVFKVNATADSPSQMFTATGDQLALDLTGKATGLTLDFMCLGCHRAGGQAARSYSYEQVKSFAPNVHGSK